MLRARHPRVPHATPRTEHLANISLKQQRCAIPEWRLYPSLRRPTLFCVLCFGPLKSAHLEPLAPDPVLHFPSLSSSHGPLPASLGVARDFIPRTNPNRKHAPGPSCSKTSGCRHHTPCGQELRTSTAEIQDPLRAHSAEQRRNAPCLWALLHMRAFCCTCTSVTRLNLSHHRPTIRACAHTHTHTVVY